MEVFLAFIVSQLEFLTEANTNFWLFRSPEIAAATSCLLTWRCHWCTHSCSLSVDVYLFSTSHMQDSSSVKGGNKGWSASIGSILQQWRVPQIGEFVEGTDDRKRIGSLRARDLRARTMPSPSASNWGIRSTEISRSYIKIFLSYSWIKLSVKVSPAWVWFLETVLGKEKYR